VTISFSKRTLSHGEGWSVGSSCKMYVVKTVISNLIIRNVDAILNINFMPGLASTKFGYLSCPYVMTEGWSTVSINHV